MGFDDLPDHKQRAIELLVLGDPESPGKRMRYQDIADEIGIAEFTLRRWRHDPEFNAARKEYRERVFKPDIVEEALRTLMYNMKNQHSYGAAEVALKWSGEMIERRAVESNVNVNQQIDVKSEDTKKLMERLQDLHKQLGLSEDVQLYIGQGTVVDGEIIEEDIDKTTDKD